MVRNRWGARAAAVAILVLALSATACASDSAPSRSASGTTDPTEAGPATTVSVPRTLAPAVDATTTTAIPGTSSTTTMPGGSTTSTAVATTSTTTTSTTTTTTVPVAPAALTYPCASSVTIGPLEMLALSADTCLERRGLEWTTNQRVTVGGIDFRPNSDASRVTFDPFNARVSATGYRAFGSVLGTPLVLAEGVIDWSFQYTPSQNGPVGWSMPVPSEAISLTTVARLPGLSDVQSFPKQPVTGFADYSVVTDASVEQLAVRYPSLATADVVFPLDAIGLREVPPYTISIPSVIVQQVAGLNLTGALRLQPVSREGAIGIAISGQLELPDWLAGFKGKLGVFIPTGGTTQLDELLVDIPEIDFGVVRFEGVYLNYSVADLKWVGRVTVMLGSGADAIGMEGNIAIIDGRLQSVGVAVKGLPINIGAGASINALGGTLSLEPLGIRATGQLGLGPFVPKVGNVAFIDGALTIDEQEISMTGRLTIGKVKVGSLELKGLELVDARLAYYWAGQFNVDGDAKFFLDTAETWGIRGALQGGVTAEMISIGGRAEIRLGPFLSLGGTAGVSSRGWIGCGIARGLWFGDVRIGVSYDWGAEAARMRGSDCNTDEYVVPLQPKGSTTGSTVRNASSAATGVETVDVRAGQKMVTFTVQGVGAAATITGPDGTSIVVTGREQSATNDPADPRWMVVHQPGDTTSYVFVARPAAGTWTVTSTGAVDPVVSVAVVSETSEPKDAPTEQLRPTSAPSRSVFGTTTVDTVATVSDSDAWARSAVALLGLVLVLIALAAIERRRDA